MGVSVDQKQQARQLVELLKKSECSDFEVESILGMMLERMLEGKDDVEVEAFDSMFPKKHKYVIICFKSAGLCYVLYVNFNIYDVDACFVFGR